MIIIVTGSRNYTDSRRVREILLSITLDSNINKEDITMYHGGCRGADRCSEQVAKTFGWKVKTFHADWSQYGLKAGPIRNQRMVDEAINSNDKIKVIAIHEDINNSKGTIDMINRCKKAGLDVSLYS